MGLAWDRGLAGRLSGSPTCTRPRRSGRPRDIAVGPLVSHVVVRHPLIVANMLATLAELGGGRTIGTLATGNSAARGARASKPASLRDLRAAVRAIRGYWAGTGGQFKEQPRCPDRGIERRGCPILIGADGPRAAELAGEVGDGMLYGGTLEGAVLDRRVSVGKPDESRQFWAAPAVSTASTRAGVLEDMGAMLVAQANRALRGKDLDERGVPASLRGEIQGLWQRYDYGYHADSTRPVNKELMSDDLASYLIDNFVLWGDLDAWRRRLDDLRVRGCDGVMLILGQGVQAKVARWAAERLRSLGEMSPRLTRPAEPITVAS